MSAADNLFLSAPVLKGLEGLGLSTKAAQIISEAAVLANYGFSSFSNSLAVSDKPEENAVAMAFVDGTTEVLSELVSVDLLINAMSSKILKLQ